jgi:hypothetical protein
MFLFVYTVGLLPMGVAANTRIIMDHINNTRIIIDNINGGQER